MPTPTAEEVAAQLLAVVSHELRTPLTGILGFARTLQAQAASGAADAAAVAAAAEGIERHGHRLARTVDNLLAASSTVRPVVGAATHLGSAVAPVAEALHHDAGGAVGLVVDVPDDLWVAVAPHHLRLLVANLVDNALKFADAGTDVVVWARESGGAVTLTVTDRGAPVPPAMADRVFAPFVQADSSDTRPHDGLGLGLHVVRRICSAHGGQLDLVCRDGLVVVAATLPGGVADRTLSLAEAAPAGGLSWRA